MAAQLKLRNILALNLIFLAASLYYAHKVSFEAAADLAELSFDEFHYRLKEHFKIGYIFDDETIKYK